MNQPLWEPSDTLREACALSAYMAWLERERGLHFASYAELWVWSTTEIEAFWGSLWDFFKIQASQPYTAVLSDRGMPGAHWFAGAQLSYAEHIFRSATIDHPAIVFQSESQPLIEISWAELYQSVASVASALRDMGVVRGDRVVAYLPNIPAAVVAFLACASIGAIWSSCSPDMGEASVLDRFQQIEPKVLIAVDGYWYGGKRFERNTTIAALQVGLATLEHTILVEYLGDVHAADRYTSVISWAALLAQPAPDLCFEQLPFEHPLWVVYSSGTTGLPKPIVHSQGGILLEHLKSVRLHLDLGPGERFFWFTTTGWMMWNFLVGGLLSGTTILLYDGSPATPDLGALWEFAQRSRMTFFGTSAAYLATCMKAGIEPGKHHNLHRLRGLGSTGSPLPAEGFEWVYQHVKHDIWLASISGGTDVCTAFVGGCPLLPVYAGEIQCRCLGVRAEAFDEQGMSVINAVGEFVVTAPIPSMPIFFWGDPDGRRYRESYFEHYPGVWRHGDWVQITPNGGLIISGRSDSTINRAGIRMGTSELYRAVEGLPEVLDSLVVDLEGLGGASYMPLFVVLRAGTNLDEALTMRIKQHIRTTLSARHVPDEIFAIPEIPRTLNGKKLEVPIKKILRGVPAEQAANPDAMANPLSLRYFVELAKRRQ